MALFLAMEHLSGCPFWLPCQKACPSGDHKLTPSSLLYIQKPQSPHNMGLTLQSPYLLVFLTRMALKMCSRNLFSCLFVGCTKGCRAAREKPCWYSSRSWAGRSRREANLTAEDRGSSATMGRREADQRLVTTVIQTLRPLCPGKDLLGHFFPDKPSIDFINSHLLPLHPKTSIKESSLNCWAFSPACLLI